MRELFISYLWENRLLFKDLATTEGENVTVLHPGYLNTDSGPDFQNARIRIGETLWAGNVEVHVFASDWDVHGHQTDSAFDNVILHLVFEEDRVIKASNNRRLPTLEIKHRFDQNILQRYEQFLNSRKWIPCEKHIHEIQRFTLLSWLDRMIAEKLEAKTALIERILQQTQSDWEETFYRRLMMNLGLKVNESAFEQLAIHLPFRLLLQYSHELIMLEALLFGAGGLLTGRGDAYEQELYQHWQFLQKKHNLLAMKAEAWRFMRLRPGNFPTLRLAQLAMMINKHERLFSKVIDAVNAEEVKTLFMVGTSSYWKTHYRFNEISAEKSKHLGEQTAALLVLNSVVQLLFIYGKHTQKEELSDKALQILEALRPEDNSILKRFESLGLVAVNALQSQALLYLKSHYCDVKRCLECRIGKILIDQSSL